MYKYCTTLNSYTGDSRAAFNILSLHQNRYLIYCCRQLQVFSSRILLVLVIFLQNRGDVYIYSTVVATLQFWLKVTEMNLNHFKFYDELNHNAIQMNYSILVFIFYTVLCIISNMIESLVFSKIILFYLHSWWLWGSQGFSVPEWLILNML